MSCWRPRGVSAIQQASSAEAIVMRTATSASGEPAAWPPPPPSSVRRMAKLLPQMAMIAASARSAIRASQPTK